MDKINKNIVVSFATQYSELVIQFLSVLVLARILSPAEIGTYSVAAFLMTLLHVFRDFGVARYVVQVHTLTPEKIRSALGVAFILAWTVALVLLGSSNVIANLYQTPAIREILIIMSASFAITPLGGLLTAIFRREMQLRKILVIKLSSALCHVSVAIFLALEGFGAVSLAWANFAGILVFGIVATMLRSPGTPLLPRFTEVREILSFGSISSLGSLANVAGANAPDVVIGKIINLAAAGYFSRGNGLVQLFKTLVVGSVLPLILPHFAQLRRENGDQTKPYYSAVEHLTAFAWPFFSVMALLALPVVRTLYGPQWDASVPIVQLLCVAGAISAVGTFASEVMVANGKIRDITTAQVIGCAMRVSAILLASSHGVAAMAAALIAAECLSLFVVSHFLQAATGIAFLPVIKSTRKSLVICAWSSVIPAGIGITGATEAAASWLPTMAGLVGAAAGWIVGVIQTNHPIKALLDLGYNRVMRAAAQAPSNE